MLQDQLGEVLGLAVSMLTFHNGVPGLRAHLWILFSLIDYIAL